MDQSDQPRLLRILVDAESPFDGEATKELRRVTTPEGLRFFELRYRLRFHARLRVSPPITCSTCWLDSAQRMSMRRVTLATSLDATADYYDFLDLMLRNDLNASELER